MVEMARSSEVMSSERRTGRVRFDPIVCCALPRQQTQEQGDSSDTLERQTVCASKPFVAERTRLERRSIRRLLRDSSGRGPLPRKGGPPPRGPERGQPIGALVHRFDRNDAPRRQGIRVGSKGTRRIGSSSPRWSRRKFHHFIGHGLPGPSFGSLRLILAARWA
jgi:hypothetical protein